MPVKMDQCMIELTNNCSFACAFCIHPHMKRPRGHMDFDLFRRIVDDVKEHDLAKTFNFSGLGEPMLHPRFFDFADYAATAGIGITVITNCSLLTPEKNQRLVESGVTQVLLSIQSPNAESFKLRHSKNLSYEAYIANVADLVCRRLRAGAGPRLIVSYMSTMYNGVLAACPELSHLRAVESFGHMRDLVNKWMRVAGDCLPPKPQPMGRLGAVSGFLSSNQPEFSIADGFSVMFVDLHFWWHDMMLPDRLHVKPMKYATCPLPGTFVVWWDGRTHFCCHGIDVASDDVRERPLHEIWTSERQVKLMDALARGELIDPLCQQCRGQVIIRETGRPVRSRLPAWVQAARAVKTGRLREAIRGLVRRRLPGGSSE